MHIYWVLKLSLQILDNYLPSLHIFWGSMKDFPPLYAHPTHFQSLHSYNVQDILQKLLFKSSYTPCVRLQPPPQTQNSVPINLKQPSFPHGNRDDSVRDANNLEHLKAKW